MGSKANPALVGAFVLGAVALIVITAVMLGSGRLFATRRPQYVLYFSGSVNGLREGAAVKVRGVPIGEVKRILLRFDPQAEAPYRAKHRDTVLIPVIIEVDPNQFAGLVPVNLPPYSPQFVKEAISRGLRAQLGTESLVTGLLFVSLDFQPHTKAVLVLPPGSDYLEIPTTQTAFEQAQEVLLAIIQSLRKVDFDALFMTITQTLAAVREAVDSAQVRQVADSLNRTLDSLKKTSDSMRVLSASLNHQIVPLGASVRGATDNANLALKQATATLQTINHTFDPDSPLTYQLNKTLVDLSAAAREVRQLSDYLERNPSSLIRGKAIGDSSR